MPQAKTCGHGGQTFKDLPPNAISFLTCLVSVGTFARTTCSSFLKQHFQTCVATGHVEFSALSFIHALPPIVLLSSSRKTGATRPKHIVFRQLPLPGWVARVASKAESEARLRADEKGLPGVVRHKPRHASSVNLSRGEIAK